jgi:hypothetical protein
MHQIGPTQHGNLGVPTIGCSVALSYCAPIVCEKNRALLHRYNQHQNKGEMNNAIKGFRRGCL